MKPLFHLFVLLLGVPTTALAQVNGLERSYAERMAMRSLDERCHLLASGPKRALAGFTAQARGAALRSGSSTERLNLIANQAKAATQTKSCTDAMVRAEAERVSAAHRGWRAQMTGSYRGLARSWLVDRTGKDMWRAVQELGDGVRAGLIGTSNGLSFAIETGATDISSARIYLRDFSKIGPPSAGIRLTPPLRIGTTAQLATLKRAADTRSRIGVKPRPGTMLVFSDATTRAVLNADPRDTFEVEIINRAGGSRFYLVEVGDLVAAFAFAAEF